MTTSAFTAPRAGGRGRQRGPVAALGATRPAGSAAAPAAAEPAEPAQQTAQDVASAPVPDVRAESATQPVPETDTETQTEAPVEAESAAPAVQEPEAATPEPEPEPEREGPAEAESAAPPAQEPEAGTPEPKPEPEPAPPSRQGRRTSSTKTATPTPRRVTDTTPLVVIRGGAVTFASDAVHILDLDAADRADDAHDVLAEITALKNAGTDGPVADLVETLFDLLRSKV